MRRSFPCAFLLACLAPAGFGMACASSDPGRSGNDNNVGGASGASGGQATAAGAAGGASVGAGTSASGGGPAGTGGINATRTGGTAPDAAASMGGASGSAGIGGVRGTGGATSLSADSGAGRNEAVTVSCPGAAPAGINPSWCSCEQWGQSTTAGATYYNDIWGAGAGPQCIWIAGQQWGVAASHPNGGGVKAYPNISFSPGTTLSAIQSYTSAFDVTLPSSGAWETTYDLWVKNASGTRIEIMLWMWKNGAVFPASSTSNPAVANVAAGGHSWNVYYGAFGGNQVVTMIRTTNTSAATVDIKAILDWIIANRGSFDNSWTLDQVQFGFEIVSDGAIQSFVVNNFSVSSG